MATLNKIPHMDKVETENALACEKAKIIDYWAQWGYITMGELRCR